MSDTDAEKNAYSLALHRNRVVNVLMGSEDKLIDDFAAQVPYIGFAPRRDATPLMRAVETEHYLDVAKLLTIANWDLTECDSRGLTPVHIAATQESSRMLQMLLDYDATLADLNINRPSIIYAVRVRRNANPLSFAAIYDRVENIRFLINRGFSPNANTAFGASPLHFAAMSRSHSSIAILLARGASIDCTTESKLLTPLMIAVRMIDPQAACYLVAAGADVSKKAESGDDACRMISDTNGRYDNLDALILTPHGERQHRRVMIYHLELLLTPSDTINNNVLIQPEHYEKAQQKLMEQRVAIVRTATTEICFGLQALGLPALVTLEIVDHSVPQADFCKMHVKWNWITTVKHFHSV